MPVLNPRRNVNDISGIAVSDCGSFTKAGEAIYRDAKFMIDYSQKSIAAAKKYASEYDRTFCVGTLLLNPAKPFMDLWYRVNQGFPDYKLHLVPFDDNHTGILSEIEKLGEKFDFLSLVQNRRNVGQRRHTAGKNPFHIGDCNAVIGHGRAAFLSAAHPVL